MDDPHILYFVLRGTPVPTDGVTAWIVTLDMKRKTVLRYGRIRGFRSDDNISSGFGFFPSNFTSYLTKALKVEHGLGEEDRQEVKEENQAEKPKHASS